MSSYFGIDAADAAASGLDEFDADEGFKDINFGGALSYRFRWSVVALGTYARLLGDANQFFGDALINLSILRVGPRCKLLAHDKEAGQPQ